MSRTFDSRRLQLKYDCGLDDDGKTIVRSKSYSDVAEEATDAKILEVCETIIGLQDNDILEQKIIDSNILN